MAPSTAGWIDIHGHFRLPSSPSQLAAQVDAMKGRCWNVKSHTSWSPEETLAYLDRAGISMQMLSIVPGKLADLQATNDYGASLVRKWPSRFGLLAALPTSDPEACLKEVERAVDTGPDGLSADGFAVQCRYNDVYLSDPSLVPVWERLDELKAVIFTHPDAWQPGHMGRPAPVVEVAFETTRTYVDMLYKGIFRDYPNITWIASHGGGALPLLSDRLELLGTEPWVPNANGLRKEEIKKQLSKIYVDTAAVGPISMHTAIQVVGKNHIAYGADCGVPCSTDATMEENKRNILAYEGMTEDERSQIGRNLYHLFPAAVKRLRHISGPNGHLAAD